MFAFVIYKIKQLICKFFGHKLDDGPADFRIGDDEYWDCMRCKGLCSDKWEQTLQEHRRPIGTTESVVVDDRGITFTGKIHDERILRRLRGE